MILSTTMVVDWRDKGWNWQPQNSLDVDHNKQVMEKEVEFWICDSRFNQNCFHLLSLSSLSLLVINPQSLQYVSLVIQIGFIIIWWIFFSHVHSNRTPLFHVGLYEKIWKSHPFPLPFGNLFLKLFHFFRRRKISLNLFNSCLKIIRN